MQLIKKIDFRFSIKAILLISLLVTIFHFLILAELIPSDIVWGGKLESREQLRRFELISLAVNLFIIAIAAMKGGYIRSFLPEKVVRVLLWGFTVLFSLNTLGNLLAENSLETMLFTPMTLLLAVLFLRIAMEEKRRDTPPSRR